MCCLYFSCFNKLSPQKTKLSWILNKNLLPGCDWFKIKTHCHTINLFYYYLLILFSFNGSTMSSRGVYFLWSKLVKNKLHKRLINTWHWKKIICGSGKKKLAKVTPSRDEQEIGFKARNRKRGKRRPDIHSPVSVHAARRRHISHEEK